MKNEEFNAFFEPYSRNVGKAANVGFWKLSDAIVEHILRNEAASIGNPRVILDAGGGTGRWAVRMSQYLQGHVIVYDLSTDMLNQAAKNIEAAGLSDSVELIQGDLTNMESIRDASIDLIWSLYAPIGFVENKEQAVSELFRVLRPGGKLLLMGHSYYNALYSKITNYLATPEELDSICSTSKVKWAEYVPTVHLFSQESMSKLLEEAGFQVERCVGIPTLVQPGSEDFDPENMQRSRISIALEDPSFFEAVFKTEIGIHSLPSVIDRGVNILGIGRK